MKRSVLCRIEKMQKKLWLNLKIKYFTHRTVAMAFEQQPLEFARRFGFDSLEILQSVSQIWAS